MTKTNLSFFKNIYIPEPCEAPDGALKKNGPGSFCSHCSKQVYDFTNKSPEEFWEIFKANKGKVCGMVYEDQIDQTLRFKRRNDNGFLNRVKRWAAATVTFVLIKLFSSGEATAQDVVHYKVPGKSYLIPAGEEKQVFEILIKGTVYNKPSKKDTSSKKQFVSGIEIEVTDQDGKVIGKTTTKEGEYQLKVKVRDTSGTFGVTAFTDKEKTRVRKLTLKGTSELVEVENIMIVDLYMKRKVKYKRRRVVAGAMYSVW